MENKELLLAITELKSSLDKRFNDLEKQFDKRLDSISEELYKIKNNLNSVEGLKSEDIRGKMYIIEDEIKILNHDIGYLAGEFGKHDMKLNRFNNLLLNSKKG